MRNARVGRPRTVRMVVFIAAFVLVGAACGGEETREEAEVEEGQDAEGEETEGEVALLVTLSAPLYQMRSRRRRLARAEAEAAAEEPVA